MFCHADCVHAPLPFIHGNRKMDDYVATGDQFFGGTGGQGIHLECSRTDHDDEVVSQNDGLVLFGLRKY